MNNRDLALVMVQPLKNLYKNLLRQVFFRCASRKSAPNDANRLWIQIPNQRRRGFPVLPADSGKTINNIEMRMAHRPILDKHFERRQIVGMKTFTVRELDRVPNAVLDASDRDGAAKIRRRNGRTYTIRPDAGPDRITALPDFRARLARLFPKQIPAAQSRLVDKLLAGE